LPLKVSTYAFWNGQVRPVFLQGAYPYGLVLRLLPAAAFGSQIIADLEENNNGVSPSPPKRLSAFTVATTGRRD
jgi:hypothetical protein